jgi:hypothetical protein
MSNGNNPHWHPSQNPLGSIPPKPQPAPTPPPANYPGSRGPKAT